MKRATIIRWLSRLAYAVVIFIFVILFVALPFAGAYLITSARFRYPERGPKTPEAVGLNVESVEFTSSDGVSLRGWWSEGDPAKPVIIFCHGLNRSRLELLERGAESNRRGYGVLLFDLRNHGESGKAPTTLGINESRDACAARNFVKAKAGARPQVLWGVSMGASTAILAAKTCPGFSAIVSDSSFLSFRDTISHHLRLFFRLPSFPIANLITAIAGFRAGFNPDEGDVEAAIRHLDIPILFIAGGADRRMPPALAERMMSASRNPLKELLVVPAAGHGEAFRTDRTTYLNSVYKFLDKVRYNPPFSHTGGS